MESKKVYQKINDLPLWAKDIISRFIVYLSVVMALVVFSSSGVLLIRNQLQDYHPSNQLK